MLRIWAASRTTIITSHDHAIHLMSISRDLMGGGCPKATPSIIAMLGMGLCWPQVVLGVPLAINGVMLWVLATKLEVMPGVQHMLIVVV